MKFTKLGLKILDKLVVSNDNAYRRLRRTAGRVKELDKQVKPTQSELVKFFWLQCKGMCAPFRYNGVINSLCKFCPRIPPNNPNSNIKS